MGVNEAGWHEVAGASLDPFGNDLAVASEMDEDQIWAGLSQLIAVITRCHLVDIGLGMKVVAVHEIHTKTLGKHGINVRLPSSGYTHDDDKWHAAV